MIAVKSAAISQTFKYNRLSIDAAVLLPANRQVAGMQMVSWFTATCKWHRN